MPDEEVTPSVSYVYNNTNNTSTLGGPMFILIYLQCALFVLNEWLSLTMEYWQLVFPTFIVVVTFVIGYMNNR